MLDKLIVHPTGIGSAKLRLHPFSVDLAQYQLQVTFEVLNNDDVIVNRGIITVMGDDMVTYLKGDITPDSLYRLVISQLPYTLL